MVRSKRYMSWAPIQPAIWLMESCPQSLEFVVVQDILLNETAQQADVVLPAVSFAEKDGSMTNVDHHIQAIRRALRPLPGSKADWEILTALAGYLGQPWTYAHPRDIFREIADSNPYYAGLPGKIWVSRASVARRSRR